MGWGEQVRRYIELAAFVVPRLCDLMIWPTRNVELTGAFTALSVAVADLIVRSIYERYKSPRLERLLCFFLDIAPHNIRHHIGGGE